MTAAPRAKTGPHRWFKPLVNPAFFSGEMWAAAKPKPASVPPGFSTLPSGLFFTVHFADARGTVVAATVRRMRRAARVRFALVGILEDMFGVGGWCLKICKGGSK
ncbi:Os11g0677450 [Oryza sativa Japonica Group]|uniref:Os11g0677450 protein n=1 Tax=Oryza sativa subsp. japonica TaxID=39947 RepID=A0A0P0Y5S3_ORYSJ|nr:hypothetical protein DAI22_11g231400 [Oryza sativa Japonica Group]BAT15233.1 Os11g0677450 [Oryza sativa Japonica Group]